MTTSHEEYLQQAMKQAEKAPINDRQFRVGALLVSPSNTSNPVIYTGYTGELPGNTHAEQCCILKAKADAENKLKTPGRFEEDTVLYTTLEPCNERLSGNTTCVQNILEARSKMGGLNTIYTGVREPTKFIGINEGQKRLEAAGISVVYITGFEEEILKIATKGHGDSR